MNPAAMLEGIRVIEIGQVLAAPYAAAILGDPGAEIIKIEKPQGGDEGRRMGPAYRGQDSMQFVEVNRSRARWATRNGRTMSASRPTARDC
jgi:crotonobetainyl-CoA:carnitine CoA-transferase CaiB-like acyl-CoA transferase